MAEQIKAKLLNLNVGVLGHVDSGKTSLAKVLSTVGSTAAFDKHPQSKERGITIDLGFSSFVTPLPDKLRLNNPDVLDSVELVQFTLVDCPGHASLIRTIIGGASIIDMMILVVDVTKGVQTQTAECLVIGEITCDKMIVVLNKTDLLADDKRTAMVDKMSKRILKTLEKTKFKDSTIVSLSAKPGGGDSDSSVTPVGLDCLIQALEDHIFIPQRTSVGPFLFAVDHCFSIRGQGTVMTGTVIQGSVRINDTVEIPSLQVTKKVKSMQMFKKPLTLASQGDRIGICVTQFDPKLLERGLVCTLNYLRQTFALIAQVDKVNYFKGRCRSKAKFHVSLMHETIMAKATFFTRTELVPATDDEYEFSDELSDTTSDGQVNYVLLELEKPVTTCSNTMLIGSKLDTDLNANICRLAFYGHVKKMFHCKDYKSELTELKVFKYKSKEGHVERIVNDYELIAKSMFKKEFDLKKVEGMKVTLTTGDVGQITSSFGQSGKVKVTFQSGFADKALVIKGMTITLTFKKYIYDNVIKQ